LNNFGIYPVPFRPHFKPINGITVASSLDVNKTFYFPGKEEIAIEILSHLWEHPGKQDSIEGIIEWWLLENKIRYWAAEVTRALDLLVEKDLIVTDPRTRVKATYRINKDKRKEIEAILKSSDKLKDKQ
jgi:hypothetical protein